MKSTMKRRENSYFIPIDLTIEVLSRLPAKSIGRFRCVSKQWTSMLYLPYLTELFLTSSWTRPSILLALNKDGDWSFYSSPQPRNICDKSSSLVVAADFHMKLPRDMQPDFYCLTYGFLYFSSVWISKENKYTGPVICNPNTGRYAILPIQPRKTSVPYHFFGFDPVDKQFKVLSLGTRYCKCFTRHRIMILTLGTGELIWREIESPIIHKHCWSTKGLCINGVLYYLGREIADDSYEETSLLLVCFNVKSEKFKFIDAQRFDGLSTTTTLINCKGKLGVICRKSGVKFHMWVLEDVEKQDWSKHVYTLPENIIVKKILVVGITARGELVLAMKSTSKPFYVFYFNPEWKTLQTVEIQGLDENHSKVSAFVDHVEDLNVIDSKILKLSQDLNIIRKNPEAQQHTSGDI